MSLLDWLRDWFTGARVISNPGENRPDGADKVETDPSKDGRPVSGTTQATPPPPKEPPAQKEPKEPRPPKEP